MTPATALRLYAFVVFVSSALLMVLEIVAGRLLAPYVGVSLYTWTSIIGVVLAGLSLGNWTGGVIAERGGGHLATGVTLLAASLVSLAILPLLVVVGAAIQGAQLDLLSASFLLVLALFFVPAALLGVLSPLLTTLSLNRGTGQGRIVGRMYALSALGSILGTFVTGYWLIQWFGTRAIVVTVAVSLFLLALPFLAGSRRGRVLVLGGGCLLGLLTLVTSLSQGFADPCDEESNYYCLRVVDETAGGIGVVGRTLVLDHMAHSTNIAADPAELYTPYVHAMDTLIHRHFIDPGELAYFFAGGGAYTHPRATVHRYPDAAVAVSEIDPVVTRTARERLYLDTAGMTVHHEDARIALQRYPPDHFDVIVTDVFHDVGIPFHLTTLEYARLVDSRLGPDGLYLANVVDVFPTSRLVQAMVRTLQETFRHVGVWIERPPADERRLTFVLSASNRPFDADTVSAVAGQSRQWYNVSDFIAERAAQSEAPVLTDDYAPVERLLRKLLASDAGV